ETTGMPWASGVHMPLFFFSGCDVPLLPVAPSLVKRLRFLGPWFWRPLIRASMRATRLVGKPWYDLRRELSLPRAAGVNALLDSHSPTLVLALFSQLLARHQCDWPPHTVTTGFPFYDGGSVELSAELQEFLDRGAPPIVFTLGTAVSSDAGQFFQHSLAAAQRLGRRAVLVIKHGHNLPGALPSNVMAVDFAAFSQLFPRAEIIVHHGGIGTTGLAMRAGKPMLVVPHAWDQPDNADRVVRLGIGRSVWPRHYTAARAAHELRQLLENDHYRSRAAEIAKIVSLEHGAVVACDALQRLLSATKRA
ncbi:MAG TPA: glycosyltransferase, partial [Pirellulales bacterium]|nr:glycosyltransferase [Pirellulales bacterium]